MAGVVRRETHRQIPLSQRSVLGSDGRIVDAHVGNVHARRLRGRVASAARAGNRREGRDFLWLIEPVRAVAFRRSAFQVALLTCVSGGLYAFVWAFFIRRACASLLEVQDQPLWKSVALLVPIFNFFLMFDLGKKIQGVQWRADPARVDGALPWIGISLFAFIILGRDPAPAQIALLGGRATPNRFHWSEWIVLAVGGALWIIAIYGALIPGSSPVMTALESTWFLGSTVLAAAVLVLFAVTSRRAVADGLAMHANPSPDRIAPYA